MTSILRFSIAVSAAWLAFFVHVASAQLPSFSGAEGFGGTFSGSAPVGGWFSNATIYHVTTTADTLDANSKPVQGTLRGAFYDYTNPSSPKQQATNRIVVFDVGGTFNISAAKLDIKTVNNIYVAGQTAPSPVTVYGNMSQITKSGNTQTGNVIMRYMSFRKGTGPEEDALSFTGGDGAGDTIAHSMILDHITASWSEDENISVTNNNSDVTVQYSIIHDALVNNHAYGSLIRPKVDSNVTFHHNLYANNASRQARFGTYLQKTLTADFRNNVVYNYRDRASYAGGSAENTTDEIQEFANVNYVGNYIIAGPGTGSIPANFAGPGIAFNVDKNVTATVHQFGNMIDPNGPAPPGSADASGKYNGDASGWGMFTVTSPVTDQSLTHRDLTEFPTTPVTTQSALDAYNQVLNYAGNSWSNRDLIDTRVVNNVRNFTGPSLAAAAPIASEEDYVKFAATTSRAGGWDTDNDGMPNNWEQAHGLNPNLGTDAYLDADSDGYVNVQEYLDEVGAFPAPSVLTFVGAARGSTSFAQIANWKTDDLVEVVPSNPSIIHAGTNWQPSRFDEAQVNIGTVVVDKVGQHAGKLKIAANSGNNATLNVTSGWLKVKEDVIIGSPGATAALNLSGGALRTKTLSKDSGSSFSFTGGKLSADTISFSLVNNGGTLSPGDSIGATETNSSPTNIGTTHVVGDLTLSSGILQIELASLSQAPQPLFDNLLVDGVVALGGNLAVSTLNGFTPVNGNSWQIITAGSITGNFSSITAGYSVQKQGNNLLLFFGTPTLAGDYNNDSVVDARDYIVWRRALTSGGTLPNETASPGIIDQADYDAWRANFGATSSSGSGAGANLGAVPEPSMALLCACASGLVYWWQSGRRGAKARLRVSGSFLQEYQLG